MTAKDLFKHGQLKALLALGSIGLLLIVPFHATFTVWLASLGLNYDIVRLWKELLLVLLLVGTFVLVLRDKSLRNDLYQDRIVQVVSALVVFIALYTLVPVLFGSVSVRAGMYGLIVDTRVWLFFLIVYVLMKSGIWVAVPRYVLWPATIVVGFGLLQFTVLPADVLTHVGYGSDTIPAVQYVDNNPDFPRVQSAQRGANPLGAYLVPVILLCTAGWYRFRDRRWLFAGMITVSLVVLFGTHSRSAWLGLLAALVVFFGLAVSGRIRKLLIIASVAAVLSGGALVYALRDNDFVQNSIFHSSEASPSAVSSNEVRTNALTMGVEDIYTEPLGRGVGTAGPASVHNDAPARISENYFIQIGQEIGIIGLALYLALLLLIARTLYEARQNKVILVILASLVGVCAISMLSHAWADDTLAYIMGGLLGYGVFRAKNVQKTKTIRYNNKNKQTKA